MAAAVVPGRARAAARPLQQCWDDVSSSEPESAVTYVRMTLLVATLRGPPLSRGPTRYFFQWMRGGKQVKVSAPRLLDPSPAAAFGEKMSLYARVKRLGHAYISDDDAEPLQTELVLVAVDPTTPNEDPVPVSSAPFDTAHFLHEIVQTNSKTLSTTLRMSGDVFATVELTIKALGENHLRPHVAGAPEPRRLQSVITPQDATDSDEVAAAAELEKLRRDVREKEDRLNTLADSTSRLNRAVQGHAELVKNSVPGHNVAALHIRIRSLENQHAVAERERAEAERKVVAHISHAAKIKTTYNQLAAWYNNLRKEHAECQIKHPAMASEQTDAARGLRNDVNTTHEADYKSLEKERDELRQLLNRERSEKKEMCYRNFEVLESKARTLAELQEQSDSAQSLLLCAKKTSEEQAARLVSLQDTVDSLKSQLAEREAAVNDRSLALAKAIDVAKELQANQLEAIARARAESAEEVQGAVRDEMEGLKLKHEEETKRVLSESNTAVETFHVELSKLRREHEAAIEAFRKHGDKEQSAKHSKALALLQREYEENLRGIAELSRNAVLEARNATKSFEERKEASRKEKRSLEERLKSLTEEHDLRNAESINAFQSLKETHGRELEDLRKSREDVEREVSRLKGVVLQAEREAKRERKPHTRRHSAALETEVKSTREELTLLSKADGSMRRSSRQGSVDDRLETISILEGDIARLQALLKTESDERIEIEKLFANAKSERDELRSMLSRLRPERIETVNDCKGVQEVVPKPEINIGTVQHTFCDGRESECDSLIEERDKAIRELFRVRKSMNKEIKRLKQEKEDLAHLLGRERERPDRLVCQGQEQSPDTADQMASVCLERDVAVSELQRLRQIFPASPGGSSAKSLAIDNIDEVSVRVQRRLRELKTEIESYRSANCNLEELVRTTGEEKSEICKRLNHEIDHLRDELKLAKDSLSKSLVELQAKEQKIMRPSSSVDSANAIASDLTRRCDQAGQDREEARAKSSAVSRELESLNQSLDAACSCASSTDTSLFHARKGSAEGKDIVTLLRNGMSDLKDAAESRERLEGEISWVETAAEKHLLESRDLSASMQNEANLTAGRVQIESENVAEDREATRLRALIQTVKSRNDSLTEKLAGEKSLNEEMQSRLADAEKKVAAFEIELIEKQKMEREDRITLASERSQADDEVQKITEMRKELLSSRSVANALHSEVEKLRATNMELISERDSYMEDGEGCEAEVVNDLINTRMELAYAQEETIRLRNKLKKLGPGSAQGSAL